MRDQRVGIVMHDRESIPYMKDEWEFNAKHKWAWMRKLQVAAFQWLVKKGALKNAIGHKIEYRRATLSDRNPTIDSIAQLARHIERGGNRPLHLYVGPDVADTMMGNMRDMHHVMHFTSGPAREVMGIPWTIVPWMEGWVIVPEERR